MTKLGLQLLSVLFQQKIVDLVLGVVCDKSPDNSGCSILVHLGLDVFLVELESIGRDLASNFIILGMNSCVVEVVGVVFGGLVDDVEEAGAVEPALRSYSRLESTLKITGGQLFACADVATPGVDNPEHLVCLART